MKKRILILVMILLIQLFTPWNGSLSRDAQAGFENQPSRDEETIKHYLPYITDSPPPPDSGWYMSAGNVERTSWTDEEVAGQLHVEWYRPIEAYIPQNAQLITGDGMIFVPTSRGLYALDAANGALVWRFDTSMPIGNSPTLVNGVVYVGGYDRQLHALRASDGSRLWSFSGAGAGFSTNPLVVDGRVFAGNRDGYMYAIGAHGTGHQGQLLWRFKTGGMIDLSAAYKEGVVYFASNDNYAYALRASDGGQVWKSARLPGDGYQSYWPVIYQDKVIFSAAASYRNDDNPGTGSVTSPTGDGYGKIYDMERDDIFAGVAQGDLIGPEVSGQDWANGKEVLDASRITEYLEAKPWRRVFIVLNMSDGSEYTFDSDGDGRAEYLPAAMWGTHSGNRYPPIAGPDGTLYFSNILQNLSIPQGRVMGWRLGLDMLSQIGGKGAVDEPQSISMGGSAIYRSRCCDREGDYFFVDSSGRPGVIWTYSNTLSQQIPGYDVMWYGVDPGDSERLHGNYGTPNGIYNNHGDQNPMVPYDGRLYIHRSNTVVAFGPGQALGGQPLLEIEPSSLQPSTPSVEELTARLETEIQKMVDVGLLRPGYYNNGQFNYEEYTSYFENPGETLYTVALALPHLNPTLQQQARDYLRMIFATYFDPVMYSRTGWSEGAPREWMPMPPEVMTSISTKGKIQGTETRTSWDYPPFNFYAMWKYAQIFPEDAAKVYDKAKSKLEVPARADNAMLQREAYELNAYIAGYVGFLNLQELAGRSGADSDLRARVDTELNRLMQLRANTFSKDAPWLSATGQFSSYHLRVFNISHNFIDLVPELGNYLNQNALARVQEAVREYQDTAPYWFVTRYNATINEGGRQNLYDPPALMKAKAYILKQNRSEMVKYIDTPAFERGDLFYIQNLVIVLEAEAP